MKRSILGALALVPAAFAAAPAAAQYGDVFPDSSYRHLRAQEVGRLDCDGLWHARNEIYARNDYRFNTARGQAVFGYGGSTSNPRLNPAEKANVGLIQQYERSNYCG